LALHRVELEIEGRDDAEIATAAANAPIQIGVFLGAGMQ
jgi:hypothetical protein